MAIKRRVVDAYYNVDHSYWSNSTGSFLPVSGIPSFCFGTTVLLRLHLIHADGSQVTDYDATIIPCFAVYDDNNVLVVIALAEDINNEETALLWNADPAKGEFAILLNCGSVQLQTALTNISFKRFHTEFTLATAEEKVGAYTMLTHFNTTLSMGDVELNVIRALQVVGTCTVAVDDEYTIIEADTINYNLTGVVLQAPLGATENYGITSFEPVETGFKVFYNATVLSAGYVLRYTLTRKG